MLATTATPRGSGRPNKAQFLPLLAGESLERKMLRKQSGMMICLRPEGKGKM